MADYRRIEREIDAIERGHGFELPAGAKARIAGLRDGTIPLPPPARDDIDAELSQERTALTYYQERRDEAINALARCNARAATGPEDQRAWFAARSRSWARVIAKRDAQIACSRETIQELEAELAAMVAAPMALAAE